MEKGLFISLLRILEQQKISSRVKEIGVQIVYFKCAHTHTCRHTNTYTHGSKGNKKFPKKREEILPGKSVFYAALGYKEGEDLQETF